MCLTGLTLIIPEKTDVERDAVAMAWENNGGRLLRLGRFWEPPAGLDPATARLYGNDTFCLVLAQQLGLTLISPPDHLLNTLDRKWLQRDVAIMTLAAVRQTDFPCFIKPVTPKHFRAAVYDDAGALAAECRGLTATSLVIRSAVVTFCAEARSFVLDRTVLDCAIYEGAGDPLAAHDFVASFCNDMNGIDLPTTCVIDIGFIPTAGWAVIEANATWGAGLNGCDADKILPALQAATKMEDRGSDNL